MNHSIAWKAANNSARRLMEQFGMDTNNAVELNILALSFMEGTAYAILCKEKEDYEKGK